MIHTAANFRPLNAGAAALRAWLDLNERSASWLARKIGVTKQATHRWLVGTATPHASSRVELQRLCKIPLLAWDAPEPTPPAVAAVAARAA